MSEQNSSNKNKASLRYPLLALVGILAIIAIAIGIFYVIKPPVSSQDKVPPNAANASSPEDSKGTETAAPPTETPSPTPAAAVADFISRADTLATGYDYDGAIALLKEDAEIATTPEAVNAIAGYEATKASLVKQDISEITHVFFHSLIIDNSKAFDGDDREAGYNQVMTTKNEFLKIMESMYEKGYVLVRLHDMASEVTAEDGSKKMKSNDILLPPGKKAFVLSQDDVCYYEYMEGDGFATRMVIGEDGLPACEMKLEDGTVSVGDYDLVPILENFIQEHPDFSYKGARGVLAFTGYNGILGYRTAASYSESPTYEEDRKSAAAVAKCLKDAGWELASHSWGHRDMGGISLKDMKTDTDKWENEVDSLIGPTDIILFPFGSDIGNWRPYSKDNERLQYLQKAGFRYFCNVDSNQYWVQLGDTYLRQGRRNLDGYRMYYDLIDPESDKLSDIFDVKEVFDKDRPTPVPAM